MSDDSNLYLGLKEETSLADPTDLSTYATTPDAAQRRLVVYPQHRGRSLFQCTAVLGILFYTPAI